MTIGRPHSGPVSVEVTTAALALSRTNPTFQNPAISGPQLGLGPTLMVRAQSVGAAAVTVDTGYVVPVGHAADFEVNYNATDLTGDVTSSGRAEASLRNIAPGGYVIAGQTFAAPVGDAALGTAAPSFSIVGGTLHVTFTPPAAYPNPVNWIMFIQTLLN